MPAASLPPAGRTLVGLSVCREEIVRTGCWFGSADVGDDPCQTGGFLFKEY